MSVHETLLDDEGRAAEPDRRRLPGWFIALAAALPAVALIAGGVFWWSGREGSGPYWSVVDGQQPVTVDARALVTRLEGTGGSWRAVLRSGGEVADVDWSQETSLDVVARSRDRHVISNLEHASSIERNGRLLVLGPAYRPAVDRLLEDDPTVFADPQVEEDRQTYRLGGWIAYYSPVGAAQDRTEDVESYLEAVARCPYDADPCPGGGE